MKRLFIFLFLSAALDLPAQELKQLSDSFFYYYQDKNYDKAIPFAEQLTGYVKTNYGTDNKIYSNFLGLVAGVYFSNNDLQKAEQSFRELKEVNAKLYGTAHEEYIKGISMLAVVYNRTGQDEKTIPLLTEASAYYKSAFGDSSYEYASSLSKLAKVYADLGEYGKALPLSEKAAIITEKAKGPASTEYATIINNLGLFEAAMGHHEKAEPLLLKAADIRKKKGGEFSSDYANSLNNLAVLYGELDQVLKSAEYYSRAAAIYKETNGDTSPEYLTCLSNLGSANEQAGDFAQAELIYLTALNAAKKKFEDDWPLTRSINKKLGQLYLYTKEFGKAGPLVQANADAEYKKNSRSIAYASALNDLGYLNNHTGNKQAAETLYLQSAALIREAAGKHHPDYASTLSNLAVFYVEEKQYARAIPLFRELAGLEEEYYLRLFSVLSEAEKMNFTEKRFLFQHDILSTLYYHPSAPPSFYIDNFNMQLFLKSLLLSDSKNILESLRASSDTTVQSLFNKWLLTRKSLAREYARPERAKDNKVEQLEEAAENTEKTLVRLSSAFRNLRKGLDVKLQDIQKNLKADEAAVEFVNFRLLHPGDGDSMMYAAFVLRKEDSVPAFIPLFEEGKLLSQIKYLGKTSKVVVNMLYPGKAGQWFDTLSPSCQLYKILWKPIEPLLKGIKRVYYSPAGKLYNMAFHALVTDSASLLSDKYELRQMTSIRLLADSGREEKSQAPRSIVLMGNADFSMDSAQIQYYFKQKMAKGKPPVRPANQPLEGGWPSLPGTLDEINEINRLFLKQQRKAKILTGVNASEQNLKLLSNQSPGALFIATHGFFLPPPVAGKDSAMANHRNVYARTENPLLRSGLILSGGNYAWSGKKPVEGAEDGIVTAYEISQLNLDHTSLVALSACETGLGDVKGTEGVFGLQRAFKLAGVNKMIVSLWKVPDKETAELMKSVFSYWISGSSIQKAFDTAQAEMRKKYPPYYWAAFVLIE